MFRLARPAMACEFEIIFEHDAQGLIDIANLAFEDIARLDRELSCFNPSSEVSHLNDEAAHRAVMVTPDLFEILSVARDIWKSSDGAFDITAGPLIELWRHAERSGMAPEKQAIEDALAKVGMGSVILDEPTHEVKFDKTGLKINLGAIGKGFAVRQAVSILREYGVTSALVSGGGSTIQSIGSWNVGIRHPSRIDERAAEIELNDQAMSTSGGPAQRDPNVEEHFEHIIDPKTGEAANSAAASVSVITNDAMIADALSTVFYLRGASMVAAYPGVRALFIDADGCIEDLISNGEEYD